MPGLRWSPGCKCCGGECPCTGTPPDTLILDMTGVTYRTNFDNFQCNCPADLGDTQYTLTKKDYPNPSGQWSQHCYWSHEFDPVKCTVYLRWAFAMWELEAFPGTVYWQVWLESTHPSAEQRGPNAEWVQTDFFAAGQPISGFDCQGTHTIGSWNDGTAGQPDNPGLPPCLINVGNPPGSIGPPAQQRSVGAMQNPCVEYRRGKPVVRKGKRKG